MYTERLKNLRNEKKITQAQLSKLLGIHEYGYGQYEREYVIMPIKYLITLSNYFDVSIDYLFGFTNVKKYDNSSGVVDKEILAQRLKEFRKNHKLTQVKLASILNAGNGTIADYERGRYLIATPFLYQMCHKYHISADYLLGKINHPKYLN